MSVQDVKFLENSIYGNFSVYNFSGKIGNSENSNIFRFFTFLYCQLETIWAIEVNLEKKIFLKKITL